MEQQPENETKKQAGNDDGTPKFGRLLIVLTFAVFLMGVITWATEWYWSWANLNIFKMNRFPWNDYRVPICN